MIFRVRPLHVALVLASFAAHASGQTNPPTFAPYQTYPVGSWPESVAVGDFDSDGRNDVVLTTSFYFDAANDFKLFVFHQNTDGTLTSQPQKLDTHGAYGDSMGRATADFDGDGRTDVAVCTSAGVDFFFQRADGLQGPRLVPTPTNAHDVVIADVNMDGKQDLVIRAVGGIYLLANTGGAFALTTITQQTQGEIEIGDVTGDGRPDVVGFTGSMIHVFAQQPGGTWSAPVSYACTLGYWPVASGIAVGDVTGDGHADVVATIGGNQPGALVNVFAQLPDGTLAAPIVYPSYDIPETVVVADVDGDGKGDVVTLHGGWLAAGVYLQNAQGTLSSESLFSIPYASHYNVKGLRVADVTGDGLRDIVIASYGIGVVVLRQLP